MDQSNSKKSYQLTSVINIEKKLTGIAVAIAIGIANDAKAVRLYCTDGAMITTPNV